MLTITDNAAHLLASQRAQSGAPDTYGVRLSALDDELDGNGELVIAFVPRPLPGDAVSEQDGLTAYLAPDLARRLDRATLDATPMNGVPPHLILTR